ncbi:MAG: hypothetical protein FWD93_05010 [Coriobacteriia bacterium]|nr:hypothetical protein [Coriobacteriia bacterium]
MNTPTLITLPFDGTKQDARPVRAVDRRKLYRDLWSDMVVERLVFTQTSGANNFRIAEGALLADGAYARFINHPTHIGENVAGANVLTAGIQTVDGVQNITFRLAVRSNALQTHVDGSLIVATATAVAGNVWQLQGIAPSPIRIPDRTIVGAKLAVQTVGSAELADNSVVTTKIPDLNVTTAKIGNGAVTDAKVANGINGSKITTAVTDGVRRIRSANLAFTNTTGNQSKTLNPGATANIDISVPGVPREAVVIVHPTIPTHVAYAGHMIAAGVARVTAFNTHPTAIRSTQNANAVCLW